MTRHYSSHAEFAATEEEISSLELPVLVLASDSRGEISLVGPRRLAEVIPHAQFKILEGTGQSGHWEAAEEFDETVVSFVSGDSRPH